MTLFAPIFTDEDTEAEEPVLRPPHIKPVPCLTLPLASRAQSACLKPGSSLSHKGLNQGLPQTVGVQWGTTGATPSEGQTLPHPTRFVLLLVSPSLQAHTEGEPHIYL